MYRDSAHERRLTLKQETAFGVVGDIESNFWLVSRRSVPKPAVRQAASAWQSIFPAIPWPW